MKKDKEEIYTGLIFGLFLYLVGAIDFLNPISYIVILAVAIIIIFPSVRIIRRLINKKV